MNCIVDQEFHEMENLLLVQITLQIQETMSEARKKHTRCFDAYASYELFLASSRVRVVKIV